MAAVTQALLDQEGQGRLDLDKGVGQEEGWMELSERLKQIMGKTDGITFGKFFNVNALRKWCPTLRWEDVLPGNHQMKEDKFPIAVSESGLHICVDGVLTPKEGLELIKAVKKALFDYKALTGKHIDEESAR